MQKFKPVSNEQLMLLPPSVQDFIPAGHLARVINDVVETIDVRDIEARYSYLGQKSYHPHLLLKILFYGYSIGIRSGRKIAAALESDTAFMYLAAMYKPDFGCRCWYAALKCAFGCHGAIVGMQLGNVHWRTNNGNEDIQRYSHGLLVRHHTRLWLHTTNGFPNN